MHPLNPFLFLILLPASVYAVGYYSTAADAAFARGERGEAVLDLAVMAAAALAAITATLTL